MSKKKKTAKLQICKRCGAVVAKPRKHERWHKRPSGPPMQGPPGPMGPKGDTGLKGDMPPPPPDMPKSMEDLFDLLRDRFGGKK